MTIFALIEISSVFSPLCVRKDGIVIAVLRNYPRQLRSSKAEKVQMTPFAWSSELGALKSLAAN